MNSAWLYRYSVLVAACALVLLMTGAAVTDYDGTSGPPELLAASHRALAGFVGLLTIGLAVWLGTAGQPGWLVRLGWMALALLAITAALGMHNVLQTLPRTASTFHAFLAQLLFASLVAIAIFASPAWARGPDPVKDQGWPSLRSLSAIALFLVLLQVWLGAAFRHQAAGLMPHMAGAMVVALVALIVCMFVMQQFPEHRSLRPAANILLGIVIAQVVLGIIALTARMMTPENTLTGILLTATVAHVTTGALTLAATVALVIQIRRNVLPASQA